jgi:competence protein ComEA
MDDAAAVRQRLLRLTGARSHWEALSEPVVASGSMAPSDPAVPLEPAGFSRPAAPAWPESSLPGLPSGPAVSPEPAVSAGTGPRLPVLGGPSPFDPGRRGVKALAVVAVLVVLVAGFLAWRSRPRPEPVTPGPPAPVAAGAPRASTEVAAAGGAVPVASPEGVGAEIVVAVAGKVRRPGLVRLPAGARVADAIDAAGGVLPGTDVTTVNLARKVADGELIVVGAPAPAAAGGPAGPASPGSASGAGAPGEKVNLNTATLAQLDALPGVGPVLAQRILDFRTSHGGFRSVTDLRQVDGIGESRFEELKDLVAV